MIEKFKLTISGIENIINQIETVDEMTLSEFLSLTGPNKVELYELWHSVNLLTLNDSRYSKIFQDIRSVLNFMGDEIQNIEKKNLGVYEFFNTPKFEHWDSQYKKGKLRKDILKYYNKIFNKLSKILKKTTKIANSKPKKSIY